MIIDQNTYLYGVLGKPIGHSLSPTIHNAAFSATGINAVYLAFETEDLEGSLKGASALGIKGMSVTIPFKSEVIPYLDKVDPIARKIGAVNTVINNGGRLEGYNTDALGALRALEEKTKVAGRSCIILGAGGAARAIGFVLKEKDVKLSVINRSLERGEELARSLRCSYVSLDNIEEVDANILVQTTPVGMYPHVDQCPVPEHIIKEGMVVMDIIYNPLETKLLRMAKARRCITISGFSMFIHQAAEQFRLWTGLVPPFGVMIRTLEKYFSVQQ